MPAGGVIDLFNVKEQQAQAQARIKKPHQAPFHTARRGPRRVSTRGPRPCRRRPCSMEHLGVEISHGHRFPPAFRILRSWSLQSLAQAAAKCTAARGLHQLLVRKHRIWPDQPGPPRTGRAPRTLTRRATGHADAGLEDGRVRVEREQPPFFPSKVAPAGAAQPLPMPRVPCKPTWQACWPLQSVSVAQAAALLTGFLPRAGPAPRARTASSSSREQRERAIVLC